MLIHNIPQHKNRYIVVGAELSHFLQLQGFLPVFVDLSKKEYYYIKSKEVQRFKKEWLQAHSSFNI